MFKIGLVIALCGLTGIAGYGSTAIQSPETALEALQILPQDKLTDIDEIIHQALNTFNVPGGAVGVVVNGEVVLSKGYGVRDREQNLPVTENTLFAIGSCTKAFTTLVLGQLVDEGKIAWDDPVIKCLPEFRLKDEHATYRATIKDLVTHRSELPGHDSVWYYNSDFPRNELIDRLQYLEFSSDLCEKFQYNNLMYGVAGLVIEKMTGQTWEEAIKSRIFIPLGMDRSNLSVQDSQMSDDFSLPYQEKDGQIEAVPFDQITNVGPAGSINSSVSDMTKWLRLQLSDGCFADKSLIQKRTLQEIHTLQMPISSYPTEPIYSFGYGLGWMIGVHNGHYCVSHGGCIDGFISDVTLLPQDGIGVVVLSNNCPDGSYFVNSVTNVILDRLIDAESVDWIAKDNEIRSQVKEVIQKNSEASTESAESLSPLDHYVGSYEHSAYGVVKIYLQEGSLKVEFCQTSFELQHNNYDAFTIFHPSIWQESLPVQFSRDSSGKISELHIPLEPSVEPIVFKKTPDNELLALNYLKQFPGIFEGAGMSLEVQLIGNQLALVIAGQPAVDLIATKSFLFALKGVPGCNAEFITDPNGAVTELYLTSPNGKASFKAKDINEQ